MTRWLSVITPTVQVRILTLMSIIGLAASVWYTYDGWGTFGDLKVYLDAAKTFREGGDPYPLNPAFIYSPAVLRFLALFGAYLPLAMGTFYVAAIIFFLRSPLDGLGMAVFLTFGIFLLTEIPLLTVIFFSNIAFFSHTLILGFWLRRHHRWCHRAFHASVIIFSLVKPYFAAYVLLPMLTDRVDRRRLTMAVISLLVISLAWYSQWLFDRSLFLDFLHNLRQHFSGSETVFHMFIGYGLYRYLELAIHGYTSTALEDTAMVMILHFAIIGILILVWKYRVQTILEKRNSEMARVALIITPIILCLIMSPRLGYSDFIIIQILFTLFFWRWGVVRIGFLNDLPVHGISILAAAIIGAATVNYLLAPLTLPFYSLYHSLYVFLAVYLPLILYAFVLYHFVLRRPSPG